MNRMGPWAAATALLLGGCASLTGGAPQTPTAAGTSPVADRLGAAAAAAAATAPGTPASLPAVAEWRWQDFFTDARLKALIGLALEHNRDLRVAALNVEQARAQAATRDADLLPTLQAGITGARVATNTGGVSTTVSGGLLTTAYEVDLFGRVRQQARAADEQLKASLALRQAAQSALVAAVVAADINLRADESLLALTRQTLRNREESLELARRRVAVGAASALESAQAEALLQSARATLQQVERQRAVDLSSLVLLVGTPLPNTLPAGADLGALLATGIGRGLPEALPSAVLMRRPDVQAAEAQMRASAANLEAARAALFPRISLTASLGQASRDLSSLFAGGNWVWGVAPQVLQTLFDSGRLRAGVQSAAASERAALAQYEKAIQAAFKETHDALIGRQTLQEQLTALQAQVQAESERLRLAEVRHRLGASPYLEVLDAQRSLLAAQTSFIQAQALLAQNAAGLYKALGGGGLMP